MNLDPKSIRDALADGTASLRDILHESLRRARVSEDPAAWIHLASESDIEAEIARLENALRSGADLPLFGLPFAVKDNIDVSRWPTTAGCPDYSRVAERDATVVARLRAAGAVPMGKTNLDQFATGLVGTRTPYGACRSVFDSLRISGGSSSGSAVVIALDHVSFALGTDTAGSGRIPAAFGNVVGFKPTRGVIPTTGVVPACASLDCVSVFARSCQDAREILQVAAGPDAGDPRSRAIPTGVSTPMSSKFVFAVPESVPYLVDPAWKPLWEAALERLERMGGRRVPLVFSPWEETAALLYEGPWVAERWAAVGDFIAAKPDSVHPVTRKIIEGGASPSASDLFKALDSLEALRARIAPVWRDVDCVVLPTAGYHPLLAEVEADPFGLNAFLGRGTNFCNLLDLSAVAVPAGFDARGLPFGATFFAPAFRDLPLLSLGARFHGEQNLSTGRDGPRPSMFLPISEDAPRVLIAVAGLHMDGLPLNHELRERGGWLEKTTRTSAAYRAYRIVRGERSFPGMVRGEGGAPFEVEVWSFPPEGAGSLLASCVRPPLCLGNLELEDGTTCMGFLAEPYGVAGMEEITATGGWRAATR